MVIVLQLEVEGNHALSRPPPKLGFEPRPRAYRKQALEQPKTSILDSWATRDSFERSQTLPDHVFSYQIA